MSWTYNTRPDGANRWYETVVGRPAGFRRGSDDVIVSSDRTTYKLPYVRDVGAQAGSDTWNLPIRYTGLGNRQITIQPLTGGGDPPPDRPIVQDARS